MRGGRVPLLAFGTPSPQSFKPGQALPTRIRQALNAFGLYGLRSARTTDDGLVYVGQRPTAVTVGLGRIWVTNAGDDTVSAVTPGPAKRS